MGECCVELLSSQLLTPLLVNNPAPDFVDVQGIMTISLMILSFFCHPFQSNVTLALMQDCI